MNKKGFTLMELIIAITLIALVGTIFTTNFVKSLNDQKNKQEEEAIKMIESAACTYAALKTDECQSGCVLSGDVLITEGLIDEEVNGLDVSQKTVSVTYVSGQRKCEIQE